MMNIDLKQERRQLLKRFTKPQYEKYKIARTTDPSIADLTISPEHNIFDYLAIGMFCIFKEATADCEEKKVTVCYKNYPEAGATMTVWTNNQHVDMYPNALYDLSTQSVSSTVLRKYFKEDELYDIGSLMPDFLFYTDVTAIQMGIIEIDNLNLEFQKFSDTVKAQKMAFNLLKYLSISHWLGALQEFYNK